MAIPVAILFVDIAGSTGLYERLGNTVAKGLVTACLELLGGEVQRHTGEVVQAIGDELMCRFPSADLACAAAIAMQQRIAQHGLATPLPLKVRIGLQWGEALNEGNNLYGDAVNTAARLASIAQGGQIMTSEHVVSLARKAVGNRWREIGALPLRGKEAPLRVCEILWEADHLSDRLATTMITRLPTTQPELRLTFRDTVIGLHGDRRAITLGREPENDLVIPYPQVSRAHATIECRLDKYYLVDHSTNGTTLVARDGTELTLHREETTLTGSGEILCGYTQQPHEVRAPVHYVTLVSNPALPDREGVASPS